MCMRTLSFMWWRVVATVSIKASAVDCVSARENSKTLSSRSSRLKVRGWGMRPSTAVAVWHLTSLTSLSLASLMLFFQNCRMHKQKETDALSAAGCSGQTIPSVFWSPGSPGDRRKSWLWQKLDMNWLWVSGGKIWFGSGGDRSVTKKMRRETVKLVLRIFSLTTPTDVFLSETRSALYRI